MKTAQKSTNRWMDSENIHNWTLFGNKKKWSYKDTTCYNVVEPEKHYVGKEASHKRPLMYGSHLRKMLRRGRSIKKKESTIGYLELGAQKGEMVRKILSDYYLV